MIHIWLSYLIKHKNFFKFSYVSLAWTECFIGSETYSFPLWFIQTLNFISNYLEWNANHVDHRIQHQGIAKVLQCYNKKKMLSSWLKYWHASSSLWRWYMLGWRRSYSFNLEAKSRADVLERARSLTKSLSSKWCKSYGIVKVEELLLC